VAAPNEKNDQTTQQSTQSPSTAGPTSDPNVTRDAQGREHHNKGKHKRYFLRPARNPVENSASASGAVTMGLWLASMSMQVQPFLLLLEMGPKDPGIDRDI